MKMTDCPEVKASTELFSLYCHCNIFFLYLDLDREEKCLLKNRTGKRAYGKCVLKDHNPTNAS